MARTSTTGYRRQYGSNGKNATPAVFSSCIQLTQDPTAASADTGKVLPKGAIPIWVANLNGGATGGASPTVDIGTQADPDGLSNEIAADTVTGPIVTGALLGVTLTEDTPIYAGVGASAATGGSVLIGVYYIMEDDGKQGD